MLTSWKKSCDQPRQHIKKQRHYITLPTKAHLVKAMVYPVVMYGCESWTIKKAEHQRIDAFELWCWDKTLESPLDCKEIKPVNLKGNQSWIFIGRTEAEAPILWLPNVKNWLTGKDAGKDWRQEEEGTTKYEMVGWHHRLDGREFEQAPRVGDGQGCWPAAVHGVAESQTGLSNWTVTVFLPGKSYAQRSPVGYSPCGCKESDMT